MHDSSPAVASAYEGRRAGRITLRWMYLLVLAPVLTDIVETGGWPHSAREWITEACAGVLILLLVRKVSLQQRALLAHAHSDALTGLASRAMFDDALETECARARRSKQPLTLIYFDLDNFKHVNDTAGHGAGDRVLRQVGDAIRHSVRERIDRGFRIGGDEFALLLPASPAQHAHGVVERIRSRCADADPIWRDGLLGISAGIVELRASETGADFVRRADEAMFDAKRARGGGRASRL